MIIHWYWQFYFWKLTESEESPETFGLFSNAVLCLIPYMKKCSSSLSYQIYLPFFLHLYLHYSSGIKLFEVTIISMKTSLFFLFIEQFFSHLAFILMYYLLWKKFSKKITQFLSPSYRRALCSQWSLKILSSVLKKNKSQHNMWKLDWLCNNICRWKKPSKIPLKKLSSHYSFKLKLKRLKYFVVW